VQRATPTEVAVMAEHAAAASAPTSTAMTPASVSQTVQPAVQANTSDTASRNVAAQLGSNSDYLARLWTWGEARLKLLQRLSADGIVAHGQWRFVVLASVAVLLIALSNTVLTPAAAHRVARPTAPSTNAAASQLLVRQRLLTVLNNWAVQRATGALAFLGVFVAAMQHM